MNFRLRLALLTILLAPALQVFGQNDSAYWNNRFFQLLRWTYVDDSLVHLYLPQDTSDQPFNTSTYQRIAWYGYSFQPSDQWPVVFSVAIGDGDPQTLTLPALEQLAKWGAFLTNEDYRHYNEELEIRNEELTADQDAYTYRERAKRMGVTKKC